MIRRPPRVTRVRSSAASDVYKRQPQDLSVLRLATMVDAARLGTWCDLNADTTASLATDLLDDLFSDVLGNLRVGVELHRVVGTTLSLGPQVANISEHL